MHSSSFSTSISYEGTTNLGDEVKIYYTFNEKNDNSMFDKDADDVYTLNSMNPYLTIDKSTKLTAVAYVYSGTTVVRRSAINSIIYYLNNKDIKGNYTLSGGTIITYSGADPDLHPHPLQGHPLRYCGGHRALA